MPPPTPKTSPHLEAIDAEYRRATKRFGAFASRHEAYGVLKEEVDEFWDAVKDNRPTGALREEAVQIGAMALKVLVFLDSEARP